MTTRATAPSSISGNRSTRGYVLIERDHLVNLSSLEHERWKRAHDGFRRNVGIGQLRSAAPIVSPFADLAATPTLAAEVEVDRIPERVGEIERLGAVL